MGIMDSLKTSVAQGPTTSKAAEAFSMLLNQSGGMQGLIKNFQEHGVGHIVQSWVGTGSNLSIQPDQLRSVIGEGPLNQIAQKVGMDPGDLLQKLAQYLPQVIDQLTPGGQVHDERFSTSNLLNLGKSLFH